MSGTNGQTVVKLRAGDAARVRALGRSLDDWAQHVKTSTGQIVARGAVPGELASKHSPCPACAGEGVKRVRGIPRPCERCSGSGKILVDGYTGREGVADDRSLTAHYEHQRRDPGTKGTLRAEERERNDAQLLRLETATDDQGEDDAYTGACSAKERQWKRGSYGELESVLRQMRDREPRRYRDFLRFVVGGLPIATPRMEARVERICLVIAGRMSQPIRVPGGMVKSNRERHADKTGTGERNAEIRRLYDDGRGWKQARLAREFGLSQSAVSKIVRVDQEEAA